MQNIFYVQIIIERITRLVIVFLFVKPFTAVTVLPNCFLSMQIQFLKGYFFIYVKIDYKDIDDVQILKLVS
jgi:hypothetical protein